MVAVERERGVCHMVSRVSKLEGGLEMEFRDRTLGFGVRNYR